MGTIVGGLLVGTEVYVAVTVAIGVLDGNSLAVGGTGVCVLVAVTVCVAEGVTEGVAKGVTEGVGVGTVAGTAVAVAATATVGSTATRCTGGGAQPANTRLKMNLTLVFNSLMFEWIHPLLFRIGVSIK